MRCIFGGLEVYAGGGGESLVYARGYLRGSVFSYFSMSVFYTKSGNHAQALVACFVVIILGSGWKGLF